MSTYFLLNYRNRYTCNCLHISFLPIKTYIHVAVYKFPSFISTLINCLKSGIYFTFDFKGQDHSHWEKRDLVEIGKTLKKKKKEFIYGNFNFLFLVQCSKERWKCSSKEITQALSESDFTTGN